MPPGVEMPPGVVVGPGGEIPAGWQPGDPLPSGAIPAPTVPPGVEETGATPPTFIAPGEPGPAHAPSAGAIAPVTVTIYGEYDDGYIIKSAGTWTLCRDAEDGDYVNTDQTTYTQAMRAAHGFLGYNVARAFFFFDLSTIPAGKTATAVLFSLTGWGNADSSVSVFRGTMGASLTATDYNEYGPTEFARLPWTITANQFTFNQDGRDYITSHLGATAKLCCREYEHDVLNISPGTVIDYLNGCAFAETGVTAYKPSLTITY
jgi:hypothetical protein